MTDRLAIVGGTRAVTASPPGSRGVEAPALAAARALLVRAETDASVLSDLEGSGVVAAFELAFASAVGARYAVAVSSGTAGLMTALVASGIGPGDEVIVCTYGWGSTVGAVLGVGAIPVFADIDSSFCLCPRSVEEAVTGRTKSVIATHLFGHAADISGLSEVCERHGLTLLFDAAQALGTTINGAGIGGLGTASAFSLGRTKLLPAGEGGVITTNDEATYERLVLVSQHPIRARHDIRAPHLNTLVDEVSLSLRLHGLAAVIATAALPAVPAAAQARRATRHLIVEATAGIPGLNWPDVPAGVDPGFHIFALSYTPGGVGGLPRQRFVEAMQAEGVPMLAGPVREPIHERARFQEVTGARRGGVLLTRASERCGHHELMLESPTQWVGVRDEYARQVAAAMRKVCQGIDQILH